MFLGVNRKISVLESLFNKVDSKDTKEAPTQVFSCEYCEIFKNTFIMELIQWLILLFQKIRIFEIRKSQENIGGGGSIHLHF